jgi:mannose-6-phosphate isomerase-like protein (cupin superfamily)
MKRTLLWIAGCVGAFAFAHSAGFAQAPADSRGGAPAAQAAAPATPPATPASATGRGDVFNPEISNERRNVNIDRFFGVAGRQTPHLSHGGLLIRPILRNGDPYSAGAPGAVLEYRTQLATAMLLPRDVTSLMKINSQFLFYVTSGEGRLDDGNNAWQIRPGMAILIPQDVERRFANTSTDSPLEMVLVEWPANALARKDILVRDTSKLPWCEENVHWNNMSKCVFTADDGMTGRVLLVMLMPLTMATPHTHTKGTEEIWTKLTPGDALMILGSELREMPQYSAFTAIPDGQTWHGQMNPSKTQVEQWLYVAGGNAATAPPAPARQGGAANAGRQGGGGGGRGNANPNLSRDPAVVRQADVKPAPLQ